MARRRSPAEAALERLAGATAQDQARADVRHPGRPSHSTFRAAGDVAIALSRTERGKEIHREFADHDDLVHALIEHASRKTRSGQTVSERSLLAELRAEFGDFVTRVDVGHLAAPSEVVALNDDILWVPTSHWRPGHDPSVETDDTRTKAARAELRRRFPAIDLDLGRRYDYRIDSNQPVVRDLRTASSLFIRGRGTAAIARSRAVATARLVVAGWSVLEMPAMDEMYFAVWPIVTEVVPIPTVVSPARVMPDEEIDNSRVRFDTDRAFYVPPSEPTRSAPARAIQLASQNQPAATLLAASRHWFRGVVRDAEMTHYERLAHVSAALDLLREPIDKRDGEKTRDHGDARLKALLNRTGLADEIDGWEAHEVRSLAHSDSLAREVRNSGMHRRDSVRRDLGLSPTQAQGALVAEEWRLAALVGAASIRSLWRAMVDSDYDSDQWERFFRTG